PGVTYSGSVNRGEMQIWTAQGLKVNTGTLTLTWTGGATGGQVKAWGYSPTGGNDGSAVGTSTTPTGTISYATTVLPAGTPAFGVSKLTGNDGAVTYTIAVSGTGSAVLPSEAKSDLACQNDAGRLQALETPNRVRSRPHHRGKCPPNWAGRWAWILPPA